jgi:alkylation response protein AidB-like acyl-CoA dehydrogenase
MTTQLQEPEKATFVETALKLGGKSDEEAKKTGALDRADEQVEALFAKKYQTSGSPVHRAVWDNSFPVDLFLSPEPTTPPECEKVMQASLEVVRRHVRAKTLLNEQRKITDQVLNELGSAGYWGLLVDREYGGSNAPFKSFARFLRQMATVDPTVAGLASVHGCIGAVDPIRTFGSAAPKAKYLPLLASGRRLSAFALTEPCAGSDLTALRTEAKLDGDHYVVNGEKLFITNAIAGRTIGLVCLVDKKPAVLIADLPDQENDQFQTKRYGLYALKHSYNNGLLFKNFKVPKENLLEAGRGDGLTIAYHGLNRGRVALCANAAGTMRAMLANMLPWARFRKTYGAAIETRELVRRRCGRMAALIVACDALVDWCGWQLDEGFRGEMECIIAKIFGSEAQKEAAIELFMKTHGGRAFLHGHLFGDNVHEFLAPCIYEGEGEMLGMAFLKSLIKEHGTKYYEPIGKALAAAGLKTFNPRNLAHVWAVRDGIGPYAKWRVSQFFGGASKAVLPMSGPSKLREHAQFAANQLQKSRRTVDGLMQTFKLALADRQCSMAELSLRIQDLVVILVTALWASRRNDELIHTAADILCQDLRRKFTGERPSSSYFKTVTKLGEAITAGGFSAIAGIDEAEILMPYSA